MASRIATAATLIGFLVLVLGPAAPAIAAGPGTVNGRVVDSNGNPLADVAVLCLAEGSALPSRAHSSKKGKFAVRVPDKALVYEFRFTLEGYREVVQRLRPNMEGLTFIQTTMAELSSPSNPTQSQPAPAADAPPPPTEQMGAQRSAAIRVFNEGVAALQADDGATAEAKFREAADIDPTFPGPYRAIAAIAMANEDYAAAAQASRSFLALETDDVLMWRTAYFANFMIDDVDRMVEAARRLTVTDPPMVETDMVANARNLFEANAFSPARSLLEVIIEARPDIAEAHLLLGLCCQSTSDDDCARKALTAFLELAPDHEEAATARSLLDYLQQ